MKKTLKNAVLIFLLLLINVAIFLYCQLTYNEANYLWNRNIDSDARYMVEAACMDNFRIHYFLYSNTINLFLFGLYAFQWNKLLSYVLVPFSLFILWGGKYFFNDNISKNYYTIFKYQAVDKEYKIEPIKSAGKGIGKYLMEDIQNDYSAHRIDAIRGVGIIKYKPSISALSYILTDSEENKDVRKEAYFALKNMQYVESDKELSEFLNKRQDLEGEEIKKELANY